MSWESARVNVVEEKLHMILSCEDGVRSHQLDQLIGCQRV